jgi:hypothetical protein
VNDFMSFLRQMMASGEGGPMPEPAPTPGGPSQMLGPAPKVGQPGYDDPLTQLLYILQAASKRGKAGDLYDSNNEMGGSPLQGLFGSR